MENQLIFLIISLILNFILIMCVILKTKECKRNINFKDLTKTEFELKCVECIKSGNIQCRNFKKLCDKTFSNKDKFS